MDGFLSNEKYSQELKEVLSYMTGTLVHEFPIDSVTPEYLIVSMLDVKNNHANMILDNYLMSNNLDSLRKTYTDALESHMKPQLKRDEINFNEELIRLLNCASQECEKMGSSNMGTEHVLLAILNRDNGFKACEIFEKFRLKYHFLFEKCKMSDKEKATSAFEPNRRPSILQKQPMSNIPLKSQINTKTFSNQGSGKSKYISQYTNSINQKVREGEVDDIVGRDREIKEIVKVLSRRNKNNAILVGNSGCGKSAICFGIAKMIENQEAPSVLEGKELISLNMPELISGTHFRGMFEERVNGLFSELQSNDKYILLIDDIHNVIKGGSKDKDTDISGMIGNILSEGKVRVIATTTFKEYRNTIEANTSISRKFQKIVIEPNTKDETIEILRNCKKYYENFHNVEFGDEELKKIVELADRYVTDRCLPDSAIDVMDMSGASVKMDLKEPDEIINLKNRLKEIDLEKFEAINSGNFEAVDSLNSEENVISRDIADFKREQKARNEITKVTEADIANVISEMTNIPINKLSTNEKKKLANINDTLKKDVIGQDEAIDDICKTIKRNKVGLGNKNRPSTFLLVGKSGVGKTLIAKKLAEEIFGDEKALIRIDMSEYSEKSSVAKLTGAAPGYIGFENGGQLTEAVKHKQYCVLLLDEIEKANDEVYNVFLQLFDEGRLTDGSGQIVNFKNVIILMTSNVGTKKASELGNGIGFINNIKDNNKSIIEKEIKKKFSPEFLNRIDKIIYFNNLNEDNLKNIIILELNKLINKLNNIGYNLQYDDNVTSYLLDKALEQKEFGARPIIRLIQTNIEDEITELMLKEDYPKDYVFSATYSDESVHIV